MQKKTRGLCLSCGKQLISRASGKFCNNSCHSDFKYKQYIERWKANKESGNINKYSDSISKHVRRYMLEKANNKCQICGWSEINPTTNSVPLTINHMDGNWRNTVDRKSVV